MSWRALLKPEIQDFISVHHESDVRALAFKKAPDASWPYALILDQIKVRQKAKNKSPDLYDTDGFIFPHSDLFEQASSSACAYYKTRMTENDERFVDLTAGCGVDGFAFSGRFGNTVLVERDEKSAEILVYNASLFAADIDVICTDAVEYIQNMPPADLIFIDPQRREKGRKGFFAFEDCSPNILDMMPVLREKSRRCIIKASPLLDIEKGIVTLGSVSQVHVVQWRGECKEVLFFLDFDVETCANDVVIKGVDLDESGAVKNAFSFCLGDEKELGVEYSLPQKYIYEPDPAFQKAGGFKSMAISFNLKKLHPNTHLYTSDHMVDGFPGRGCKIIDVVLVNRKALDIKNADLKIRNFPSTVKDLRRKLKLEDGGIHRVYAVSLMNGDKKLIICEK
ncbi:MAG: THUMP-like domain-containing protein [Alphaproteobacteria bacterium]